MNVFKYFFRSFRINKRSYVINVLSLAPGLACCLLILLWIIFEINTDRFYPSVDRIATVCGYHEGQEPFRGAPPAVAPTLKAEMPEVAAATRMAYAYGDVTFETKKFNIQSQRVDADIFDVFDLEFLAGVAFKDDEVDKCVITEDVAQKMFGDKSPIGQFLEFDTLQYVVSGVLEDLPKNNRLGLRILLPIRRGGEPMAWYNNSFETYVLLRDAGSFEAFEAKIKDRAMQEQPENKLYLQAGKLGERYLYRYGVIRSVRLMGLIAFFILAVACINFVNLSTAGFMKTSFQTGVRKIVGATRRSLILSNYMNTFLLVLFSFLLAFVLAQSLLPWFNGLIGRNFVMSDFFHPMVFALGCGMVLITVLLSGFYPAFYVASLQPIKVLKSRNGLASKGSSFRNILVVVQFAVAITLVVCTIVVSKQIRMYQQMNLGYEREEVIYVDLVGELAKNAVVLKSEMAKEPSVIAASVSQTIPTNINWNGTGWSWEGMKPGDPVLITFGYVDKDWAKVLGVKFKEGTFFEQEGGSQVVINEKFAEIMGGGVLVDRTLTRGESFKVVGVLDDFMFNDFKKESLPLALYLVQVEDFKQWGSGCMMVRAGRGNLIEVSDVLRKKAKELNGGEVVEVRFLDDSVESILYVEKQATRMVSFFSVLSILISCLGLFGLAAFMLEQKRKEVGIRRVNGAKIGEIVWLLNLSFMRPVVIAFLVACPVSWFVMSRWLESYMQRTELSWWIFVAAGVVVTVVAVLTLIWSSVKAAMMNPVESLKSE